MTILPDNLRVGHTGCVYSFNRVSREWSVYPFTNITVRIHRVQEVHDWFRLSVAFPSVLFVELMKKDLPIDLFGGALLRSDFSNQIVTNVQREVWGGPFQQPIELLNGDLSVEASVDGIKIDAPMHTVIIDARFTTVNDRRPQLHDFGRMFISLFY